MQHNKLVGGVDTKSCEMDAQAQAKAEQHCSESRIEFKRWTEDTLKSQSDLRELKRKKAKEGWSSPPKCHGDWFNFISPDGSHGCCK